ncbi:MAG: cell division protein ZapD [Methylophilaceae bacterium]
MLSYELPLNEHIRTLLRLERIFKKVLFHIKGGDQSDHHYALNLLLGMLRIVGRKDLRIDLTRGLEKQILSMQSMTGNPNISHQVLSETLEKVKESVDMLQNNRGSLSIGRNKWLMNIKKHSCIPGGACAFDMPSYHYWLNKSLEERNQDFDVWLSELLPIYKAIKMTLHLLRSSCAESDCVAEHGVYQQQITPAKQIQLLKISMPDDGDCYPEVSGNKYIINVHFYMSSHVEQKKASNARVHFKMAQCNLI